MPGDPGTKEMEDGKTNPRYCLAGYYCEPGSWEASPCEPGTYNPFTNATSIGECLPCDVDSYQDKSGQEACIPCGAEAKAPEIGSTNCTCDGKHRVFKVRRT